MGCGVDPDEPTLNSAATKTNQLDLLCLVRPDWIAYLFLMPRQASPLGAKRLARADNHAKSPAGGAGGARGTTEGAAACAQEATVASTTSLDLNAASTSAPTSRGCSRRARVDTVAVTSPAGVSMRTSESTASKVMPATLPRS